MTDEARTAEQDDNQTLEEGRALRKLMEQPEWLVYREVLQRSIDIWATSIIRSEETDVAGVAALVRAKGVFKGLQLAVELPSLIVTQAQEIQARRNANPKGEEK